MKVIETKVVNIKDVIVGRCLSRQVENIKDNEDLKSLAASIGEVGQLQPCIVRLVDNKYELISGGRRYVAMSQNNVNIEVKIMDTDDLESMELGIVDNLHTKNPDPRQRDAQIYKVWKIGKKSGRYEHSRDYAKKISLTDERIKDIIYAGETAEKQEYKDSSVVKNATTRELVVTKSLSGLPDIRKKLIGLKQNQDMTITDIKDVSKTIIGAVKDGIDKKIIDKAIDMVSPNKCTSEEYAKNLDKTPSTDITVPIVIFEPAKFKEALDVLKKSPVDIQKKLVEKKINIEQAKIANVFDTEERRNQVLKETRAIENKQRISNELYNRDIKMNLETRKKQQEDLKKKGETQHKTEFDTAFEKKLEKEANKDEIHDEEYIGRYQKLSSYTLSTFANFHPRFLRTTEGRDTVLGIVRNLHDFYHRALVEVGEIKDVKESEDDKIVIVKSV